MAENTRRDDLPQAMLVPPRRFRVSAVWVIPLIAAIVAIGVAVDRILNQGPTIAIGFKSAEGMEAGKTVIKYKDVIIGQVKSIELADDFTKVRVTAQIAKHAEDLIVKDAKFWVVKPRITLSGVSGLSTLLSGNFIGFEPGKSRKEARRFTGLDVAPAVSIDQPGRRFVLKANDVGSLGTGSPIYFRRLHVGQVTTYKLSADGKSVEIDVFVNAPYDQFVSQETRFWTASGLDVSLGTAGLEVRTESLVSLLVGGLAFDTPSFVGEAGPAPADHSFSLYQDRATAMKQPEAIAKRYVLYFNESLRGLSVGAPVTLLGLTMGEVASVGWDLAPGTSVLRGRAEIVAFPERLVALLDPAQAATGEAILSTPRKRHALVERLVEGQGLRGQLRSGNLLTGQLYVALDFFPDAPMAKVDWSQDMPEVPTVESTLPDLEAKLSSIMAKIDQIPFAAIGADLKKSIEALDQTLNAIDKAVARIDTDVTPALKPAIVELRRAMASADRVLKDTDATLLGKDAPGQQELRDALREVSSAARAVRVLSDLLERHPEALLRGKTGDK